MKAFWLAFLLACSETVPPPPPPPVDWASLDAPEPRDAGLPRATAKERHVADAYAAAFATTGFRGLVPLLAEEVRMSFGSKTVLGRDRIVAFHETLFGALEGRSMSIERIWMTDARQAFAWVLSGTRGKDTVSFKGLTLAWTKDDGSVSDLHVYFDETLPPAQKPSGPPVVVEQINPADAANVTGLRAMIDALEDDKEAAYLAAVTDDVEIDTLASPPVHGKEAVRAYFQTMRRSIGQLDTLAAGGFGAGDWAVLEYSISGVQLAPMEHVPFTRGRGFRVHIADVAELHGGKIARLMRYDDPAELTTQQ